MLKRLLMLAIVLLALLLAVEIGLTIAAQHGISAYLERHFAMEGRPGVSLSSFPITFSIARGRINRIRVTVTDEVEVASYSGSLVALPYELVADAQDVRFSPSALIRGSGSISALALEAQLLLNEEALDRYFDGVGLIFSLGQGTIHVAHQSAPARTVECEVYVYDGDTMALAPDPEDLAALGPLPLPQMPLLLNLPLASLPFEPTLLSVRVEAGRLLFRARVNDPTFSPVTLN
ncbi:MAG: LmeA family phospholipid-binding protein [Candidatus Geothermincolia bacterium]